MAYKSFILSPNPGRGMITSRSTQSLKEYSDSFSLVQNFLYKDGAFVLRQTDLASTDTGAGYINGATGPVWGIHYYNAIDPTNAAATATTTMFLHTGEAVDGTGSSTLRNSVGGSSIVTVNGNNFTTTDPSDVFFLTIKNRCFITGRKMAAGVVPTIVQLYPGYASYQWGRLGPTANTTYDAYTDVTNAFTKVVFQAAGAGVTIGTNAVTKVGGPNWDNGIAWLGKTILLDNNPYTIVSYTPITGPMTITPNYAGAATGTVNMRVQNGELTWSDFGPQYAYAYYNPNTGHITNIGPTTTISEKTISNVRVKLNNIQVTNDPEFTKIVLFRTALADGANLRPLNLDPAHGGSASVSLLAIGGYAIDNAGASPVTYVDFQSDSFLGQVLGDYQQPPYTNNPPPSDMKYMAYWDQRVWCVSAAKPSRLQYSGNAAQIPLGIPEESFPALNFLDITTDDGAITGIKVVGPSLLVATNKYLHYVAGGPAETSYYLVRVSSRGTGIDQYAFDEHPGDSSEQSASALYLSRDKRLWRQFPGGKIEDLGWQIQDKLDLIDLSVNKPAIIKVFQVGKSCMLAVGIRRASAASYDYLFYDFDEQTWHDFGFGAGLGFGADYIGLDSLWSGSHFGVNHTSSVTGNLSAHLGDIGNAHVYRLMSNTASTSPSSGGTVNTQWLDFGDKSVKKTLQEVILYVSDASTDWHVAAFFDDVTSSNVPMVVQTVSGTPRGLGSGVLRYSLPTTGLKNQFHALQLKVYLPNNANAGTKLYRIVVNYTVESTGSAGAPA